MVLRCQLAPVAGVWMVLRRELAQVAEVWMVFRGQLAPVAGARMVLRRVSSSVHFHQVHFHQDGVFNFVNVFLYMTDKVEQMILTLNVTIK